MAVHRHPIGGTRLGTLVQRASFGLGAVFVLVGLAGFVPGITTNLGELEWAGPDSGAELFGVFQVSVLHNLVHLLFGALGLFAAQSWSASRLYLIGGGLVYALLVVYGALTDDASDANFVPLDTADDWLHVGLAALMIGLGLALGRDPDARRGAGRGPRGAPRLSGDDHW